MGVDRVGGRSGVLGVKGGGVRLPKLTFTSIFKLKKEQSEQYPNSKVEIRADQL